MATIEGGEPVQKVINLTDADMQAIQMLAAAGFGSAGGGSIQALKDHRARLGKSRAQRYAAASEAVSFLRNAPVGSREHQMWQRQVERFQASITSGTVHQDAAISTLSVQYANDAYIGEQLLPAVTTPKRSDIFYTYNKRDRLSAGADDSDLVGDDGDLAEVKEGRGTDSFLCETRGNKSHVGATVIANQDAALNELMDMSEALFERRALAREKRISTVLTTAANFATGNKATLSGADQWNSSTGGNPIKNIQDGKAALWMGRGPGVVKAYSSLDVYNTLSRHPDILGLFLYGGSPIGLATPELIARFFGLDDYLVGAAREDTANEGQSASYSRLWGDYFGLVRVMSRPSLRNVGFGVTMRWTMPGVRGSNGGIVTGQWFDDTKGLGGSYYAKVGESEHHKVVANDAGYLFSDCLA